MLVIDCYPDDSKSFTKLYKLLQKLDAEPQRVPLHDAIPQRNHYQGIVISGSPHLLSQDRSYLRYLEFITSTKLPVLGICFGMQAIGMLHGASITHGTLVRRAEVIEVVQNDPIFDDVRNFCFSENHWENILLPGGFLHLARSESCEVEVMRHSEKPIYGVQFHPERSGNQGKQMLKNFLGMCRT